MRGWTDCTVCQGLGAVFDSNGDRMAKCDVSPPSEGESCAELAAMVKELKHWALTNSSHRAVADWSLALIADWERRGEALENIVSAWDDSMEDGNTLADLAREALERKE